VGSELVTSSPSRSYGGGGRYRRPRFRYTKRFEEAFPFYLSIGMTPEQYWDQDSTLVIAYRLANEQREDKQNYFLWLQGVYIYDALVNVSPVYRAFKPSRPKPYMKEPLPINEEEKKAREEREAKRKAEETRARFRAMVERINKQFLEKERGDIDGGHGSP